MQVRAYVRVSTDEQAQEGFSIPNQKQRIADYCRAVFDQEPTIAWYVDEGYSAKNMVRPAITQLRAEAQAQDTVLVLRLDRLTRSVADLYVLLNEWNHKGVTFRSVTESFHTDTPEGRFMVTLLASLAQWERERIAERVREVMSNIVKHDQRHVSKAPFGYALVEKRLVLVEREANIVRRLFEKYLGGCGTRAIAVWLNQQGLQTRQGSSWTDFTVAYLLRNPVYAGKVAWARVRSHGKRQPMRSLAPDTIIAEGTHEPIVDQQTWESVQETAMRRTKLAPRSATGAYPLTGITFCGECGGPVHGFVQRRYRKGEWLPERNQAYYRCSNRDHRQSCRLPYLPADKLEASVVAALGQLAPPNVLAEIAQELLQGEAEGVTSREAAALEAEVGLLARKQKRWDDAYESGDITPEQWREHSAALRAREAAIGEYRKAVGVAKSEPPTIAEIARALADLPLLWQVLAPAERKTVLQGLLERITVSADGNARIEPRLFS